MTKKEQIQEIKIGQIRKDGKTTYIVLPCEDNPHWIVLWNLNTKKKLYWSKNHLKHFQNDEILYSPKNMPNLLES